MRIEKNVLLSFLPASLCGVFTRSVPACQPEKLVLAGTRTGRRTATRLNEEVGQV